VTIDRHAEDNKGTAKLVDAVEKEPMFAIGRQVISAMITQIPVSFTETNPLSANLLAEWKANLPHMLRCHAYGRVAFEKEITPGSTWRVNLQVLPYDQSELMLDREGNFEGVKVGKGDNASELVPGKCWWLALDATPANPFGCSRYRGPVETVLNDIRLFRDNLRIWSKRHAIGQGVARFPEATGADSTTTETQPSEVLAARISELNSGGVLLLSSESYKDAQGNPTSEKLYDMTLSEGLRDSSALDNRETKLEQFACYALGVPPIAVLQPNGVGSYSLGNVQMASLFALCDSIFEQIVTSFQKYVVDKMCDLNHMPRMQIKYQTLTDIAKGSPDAANAMVANTKPVAQMAAVGTAPKVVDQPKIADDFAARLQAKHDELFELLSDRESLKSGDAKVHL
jgi:hypothetical protein